MADLSVTPYDYAYTFDAYHEHHRPASERILDKADLTSLGLWLPASYNYVKTVDIINQIQRRLGPNDTHDLWVGSRQWGWVGYVARATDETERWLRSWWGRHIVRPTTLIGVAGESGVAIGQMLLGNRTRPESLVVAVGPVEAVAPDAITLRAGSKRILIRTAPGRAGDVKVEDRVAARSRRRPRFGSSHNNLELPLSTAWVNVTRPPDEAACREAEWLAALLDAADVANLLGVRAATVHDYKRRGGLPAQALPGYWRRRDIEAWAAARPRARYRKQLQPQRP